MHAKEKSCGFCSTLSFALHQFGTLYFTHYRRKYPTIFLLFSTCINILLTLQSLQVPTASGPFQLDTAAVFRYGVEVAVLCLVLRLYSALKKLGKHVHYWVINDPTEMKRLLELGADGIITDRPDILFHKISFFVGDGSFPFYLCFSRKSHRAKCNN